MTEFQHLTWKCVFHRSNWARMVLLSIGWLLFACQQATVNVSETPAGHLNINKILILPFKDLSDLPGDRPDVRSPVSGRVFVTGKVAEQASDFLTENLLNWLRNHTRYTVITSDARQSAESVLSATGGSVGLNWGALSKLGQETGADAVMLNFIYRFEERVGKGFSAESPASVAFDMHLIRLMDDRSIWWANFDETQQSLGQNLFQLGTFLSRGGRWITAEEMADTGMEKILEKFPKP
jgi:hypothetical protein